MSQQAFECLKRAVSLARERQLQRVAHLQRALQDDGYDADTIKEALSAWAEYESAKAAVF